ncbi:MAG: DUF4349 domain-containing protein [Bacteroidota bacterium]
MRKAIGILVIVLILSACNKSDRYSEAIAENAYGSIAKTSFTPASQASIERKLIKTGTIVFEVTDVEKTKTSVAGLVKEFNGYISSDDQNNYAGSPRYSQVARIPADKLDDFIVNIEGLAKKVDSKNISTQDVTEEFIDVETRLTTKKELEARYRDILKQARSVKDILEVETQLSNVRGEIESMEGRLKYLTNQISFSTLTITYYQTVSGNFGFGYRFFNSFGDGWSSLLDFIIALFSAWPFVVSAGVLVWLIIKRIRARRAEKQS